MSQVFLHVYDVSNGAAKELSRSLLGLELEGIWHTSVVVHEKEYYFMGGIQKRPPGTTEFGVPVKTISYGETLIAEAELEVYLREINDRFTEETYNLFKNNCNNFSNEVLLYLVSKEIPKKILDLPMLIQSTPMGAMFSSFFENVRGNGNK